jgi:hypothetical protein
MLSLYCFSNCSHHFIEVVNCSHIFDTANLSHRQLNADLAKVLKGRIEMFNKQNFLFAARLAVRKHNAIKIQQAQESARVEIALDRSMRAALPSNAS